jgi:ankyrin repeat protein
MALWAEEAGARVLNLASGEDCDLPQLREAVEKLNAGATLGNIGTARTTPLHLAAGFGKGKAVHHLLMAGHDALVHSGAGRTPLHDACLGGHSEVLQLIVDAIPNHDCNVFDKEHQSPVHLAAYHGELKCMEVLAKAGADLKAVDTHGRQACHMAAKVNSMIRQTMLRKKGVSL